jgi:hypothetical protein
VSGYSTGDGWPGVYGTQGVPSPTNVPGVRNLAVSWTDSKGNFWLFGGGGQSGTQGIEWSGILNDLWKFNPSTTEWTWVSGSQTSNANGVYGKQGVPALTNVPGARAGAVSWIDSSDNLWLFGGGITQGGGIGWGSVFESPSGAGSGAFNDLWKFDPDTTEWTWVSGSQTGGSTVYGTQGVPASTNNPGNRSGAVSWTDTSGNLWLFGGEVGAGLLNDLWKFNPSTSEWTWVSGSQTPPVASSNVPGGRALAVGWTDTSGNFWLFGGWGYTAISGGTGVVQVLSDLWEFNPTTKEWTSMPGGPAGRELATGWTDKSGNLWLFGGDDGISSETVAGSVQTLVYGLFNDLWKFNPSTNEWTWVSGSQTVDAVGVYGAEGVPTPANMPGSRNGTVSWSDSSGNLWLFGGYVYVGNYAAFFNDLWLYQP